MAVRVRVRVIAAGGLWPPCVWGSRVGLFSSICRRGQRARSHCRVKYASSVCSILTKAIASKLA